MNVSNIPIISASKLHVAIPTMGMLGDTMYAEHCKLRVMPTVALLVATNIVAMATNCATCDDKVLNFAFRKMHLKILFLECWPVSSGPNVMCGSILHTSCIS